MTTSRVIQRSGPETLWAEVRLSRGLLGFWGPLLPTCLSPYTSTRRAPALKVLKQGTRVSTLEIMESNLAVQRRYHACDAVRAAAAVAT